MRETSESSGECGDGDHSIILQHIMSKVKDKGKHSEETEQQSEGI